MKIRVYVLAHCCSVNLQKVDVAISHKVENSVAEGFEVVLPGLIQGLVSPHRGIFYGSKELLMRLLDMQASFFILERDLSAKISNIDLSFRDSKVGRLDVSVQEA